MNDFIWRAFHRIEEFTPSCIPVNRRRIGMDFTGKLLHDLLYTAGIMKIYNCIRSAWNHCIDAVNFLRILFKICQCKLDTKFICVCQDMQYRIGRSCNRHIKHDRIFQNIFGDQIFWCLSGFGKLYHVFSCCSCSTKSCII